jgi:Notch-like protein
MESGLHFAMAFSAGGICSEDDLDSYTCTCRSGFVNSLNGNCEIDINECASAPCANSAACIESNSNADISTNSYRCICGAGFANGACEGRAPFGYSDACSVLESTTSRDLVGNCDMDVDECLSSPCQNGAECSESSTDSAISLEAYRCACTAGFASGSCAYEFIAEYAAECTVAESDDGALSGNCDVDVDECSSGPCANGGACTHAENGVDDYTCECVPGVKGKSCETDVDECVSSPCANGAACTESATSFVISLDAYVCACTPGFANGLCGYNFISEYVAECTVAESTINNEFGGNCDLDVDECVSAPCTNEAACKESSSEPTVSAGAYRCACAAGFANGACDYAYISEYEADCTVSESGDGVMSGNCDVDVDECASNPCANGAACSLCQILPVPILSIPHSSHSHSHEHTGCLRAGATCSTRSVEEDQFQCRCAPGYANGLCEYDFIDAASSLCSVAEGGTCDKDVNECASKPCQNFAACKDSRTDASLSSHAYQCACESGFANGMCAYTFIDEYKTECTVLDSMTGVQTGNCDVDVFECASNPCVNGAKCLESNANSTVPTGHFICQCAAGYSGGLCASSGGDSCAQLDGTCDIDVDECASSPCKNGAECFESGTSGTVALDAFVCSCAAGYAPGSQGLCTADFDECASRS